jgi:hypothetical protein
MGAFRYYRLASGGRLATTGEVLCTDAASARLAVARALKPSETAELWLGLLHVGRVMSADRLVPCVVSELESRGI